MAQLRLRSYHGGLGDELQFSTFAETLTNMGHEVFLLKDCPQVLPIRNPEIRHFLYAGHPFIKGELDGPWDIGDNRTYQNTQGDFIKNWEVAFDLPPVNSLPKIYYEPKRLERITGLIELSAISLEYNRDEVAKTAMRLIRESGMPFKQIVSGQQANNILLPLPQVRVSNLYEISDCIFSCKAFISLSSGLHSLAAAIRRKTEFEQMCLLPANKHDAFMASKLFIYPGVEYFAV